MAGMEDALADVFEDIKIVGLDDHASRPSGQGALMNIVLSLSARPPAEWASTFNERWKRHIYSAKRHASIVAGRLEITCMPDELEASHLPELKALVAEVNAAYRAYAEEEVRKAKARKQESQRQKDELAALKGKLKFD